MAKGQFDMNDLRTQLQQMQRMGGLGALAGMMPGMKKAKQAMAQSGMDDKVLLRMDAIIGSMTPTERTRPELLNAKRKIRVAKGSGTQVQDVNKLLKMHMEMAKAMKQIKKMGGLKGLGALFGKGGLGAPCRGWTSRPGRAGSVAWVAAWVVPAVCRGWATCPPTSAICCGRSDFGNLRSKSFEERLK
jgi:signal recognition particle subunit SRP54